MSVAQINLSISPNLSRTGRDLNLATVRALNLVMRSVLSRELNNICSSELVIWSGREEKVVSKESVLIKSSMKEFKIFLQSIN